MAAMAFVELVPGECLQTSILPSGMHVTLAMQPRFPVSEIS